MKDLCVTPRWLIPLAMVCPLACAPTAVPPRLPTAKVSLSAPGPVATIDEITLERSWHAPTAPCYKVVLRKDGTAIYTGEFNVARIGTFKAKIEPERFRRLEEMVNRFRFFEMKDDDIIFTVDVPYVNTSVLRAGKRKTINDCWGSNAPVELWAIEMAIDGVLAEVTNWK